MAIRSWGVEPVWGIGRPVDPGHKGGIRFQHQSAQVGQAQQFVAVTGPEGCLSNPEYRVRETGQPCTVISDGAHEGVNMDKLAPWDPQLPKYLPGFLQYLGSTLSGWSEVQDDWFFQEEGQLNLPA